MTAPAMWQRYTWRGHEVVVIQQWADPFGRRMIRIASIKPEKEGAAAGMPEAEFMAEAQPVASALLQGPAQG